MSVGVILGSAFQEPVLGGKELTPVEVSTRFGEVTVYRYDGKERTGLVVFRHDVPHQWLPHQIPYQAQAMALKLAGCEALLVTSSVGVLDPDVPLDQPLVVDDLLMPDNRLPDGSTCSIVPEPFPGQGHLVLEEGLFSRALGQQIEAFAATQKWPVTRRVIFAYCGGPRTKTAAENRYWAQMGAQVNSMTLGPEVVLANELEIPTAALVVGHKYSTPSIKESLDEQSITASLQRNHKALEKLVCHFLEEAKAPPFGNRIYRFAQA